MKQLRAERNRLLDSDGGITHNALCSRKTLAKGGGGTDVRVQCGALVSSEMFKSLASVAATADRVQFSPTTCWDPPPGQDRHCQQLTLNTSTPTARPGQQRPLQSGQGDPPVGKVRMGVLENLFTWWLISCSFIWAPDVLTDSRLHV